MESRHQNDLKKAEAAEWSKISVPLTPGLMSWWTSGARSWPGFQVFALLLHPDSLSWLTYAAMEAQPSDENKTCGFQAAGLEFGVPFSPLLLPRMSTELTRCLPGSRTRSCKPGGQCGPASPPTSSVQLTQGRQHPQKDQEMWASALVQVPGTAEQCTTTTHLGSRPLHGQL